MPGEHGVLDGRPGPPGAEGRGWRAPRRFASPPLSMITSLALSAYRRRCRCRRPGCRCRVPPSSVSLPPPPVRLSLRGRDHCHLVRMSSLPSSPIVVEVGRAHRASAFTILPVDVSHPAEMPMHERCRQVSLLPPAVVMDDVIVLSTSRCRCRRRRSWCRCRCRRRACRCRRCRSACRCRRGRGACCWCRRR